MSSTKADIMSSSSSIAQSKIHRLDRRRNKSRSKSLSDLNQSEEQDTIQWYTIVDEKQSSSRKASSDTRSRKSRHSLRSHRASSTSKGPKKQSPHRSLKSRHCSRGCDLVSEDKSSSKKHGKSSRPGLKSHRSSCTGDITNETHSSSSPKNRRKLGQRSASANDLFEEPSGPQTSGSSSNRRSRQHSRPGPQSHRSSSTGDLINERHSFSYSKNRKRSSHSSGSMDDLLEELSELHKPGFFNTRMYKELSSSLSDISISGTDYSDGFQIEDLVEYDHLEEHFNSSNDLEECFNSSGGDLRMISEDSSLDGSVEIEFCYSEYPREERVMGPKQNSRRSLSSTVSDAERSRVDEAFMSYAQAEKAALMIQTSFRRKKQTEREQQEDGGTQKDVFKTDEEKGSVAVEKDFDSGGDTKNWCHLVFFAVVGTIQTILFWLTCFLGGSSDVDVPLVDLAATGFGGGGGGVGAPPPGLEAMAGQAAASAGSSAGTGVTAGASAGAAAGATSAGAAAAATGAATAGATSQVVTAVVVTSAVATAASTTGVFTSMEVAKPPIISRCGLIDPQARVGKFAMVFEGFSRALDDRESLLLEGLVLDAYNNLTIGEDLNATGACLDPLSREMKNANIMNQTFVPLAEGTMFLEVLFETSIICDNCSPSRPLFKNEKLEEAVDGNEQQEAQDEIDDEQQLEDEGGSSMPQPNATRLLRRKQNRRSLEDREQVLQVHVQNQGASFDKSGANFFHRLIQMVVLETEKLSKIGDLPEGFVGVARAYVKPTPIENGAMEATANDSPELEDALVTAVKYEKQDGKSSFEFSFVDEKNGSNVTKVVVLDHADDVVTPNPSTPFPAFGPTRVPSISPTGNPTMFSGQPTSLPSIGPTDFPSPVPTDSPSVHPTINFSGQPTFEPSSKPSGTPSAIPSDRPSARPSISPSNIPSYIPSVFPSSIPSIIPSDAPSVTPSESPSDVPSVVPSESPSMVPSTVPSDVPSLNPSSQPSDVPSTNPSSQPSDIPSFNPSSLPSMVPSDVPSVSMVPSATPSDAPSSIPSASPSRKPSTVPSESPSATPSKLPSMVPTDVPTVSMVPSRSPSASPSANPTVSFVPTLSAAPSTSPTVSMHPSANPSARPSANPSLVPSASSFPPTS